MLEHKSCGNCGNCQRLQVCSECQMTREGLDDALGYKPSKWISLDRRNRPDLSGPVRMDPEPIVRSLAKLNTLDCISLYDEVAVLIKRAEEAVRTWDGG